MNKTDVDRTFLLRSRAMLVASVGPEYAPWSPRVGDSVELVIGEILTFPMRIAGIELALPISGGPCKLGTGLVPRTGSLQDLFEIYDAITSRPGERISITWDAPASAR